MLKRLLSLWVAASVLFAGAIPTALATNEQANGGAVSPPDGPQLYFKTGTIGSASDPSSFLLPLGDENDTAPKLFVVQFNGPIDDSTKQALAAEGASVESYVPDFAYLVSMTVKQAERITSIEGVNRVVPYLPEWKISPDLSNKPQIETRITVVKGKESVVAGKISSASLKALRDSFLEATLSKAEIEAISLDEHVIFIEEISPITTFNAKAAEIVKASTPGGAWANGLTGQGQIVGVMDSGLDTGVAATLHPDLRDRLQVTPIAYARPEWSDLSGHGTHVAGSIVGTGAQSAGVNKGIAPSAKLVFQSVGVDSGSGLQIPFPFDDALATAASHGATIHSNSWGGGNYYSELAMETDQYTFANKQFSVLFAAGNAGPDPNTVSDPGLAKNAITVGATQNNRPDVTGPWPANNPSLVAEFSARGSTVDGRVKPDVVAPGTLVLSTRSSLAPQGKYKPELDANYGYNSGTSMATPIVAGSTALVRQYYTEQKAIVPSSALLKATLINGAQDIGYGWMSRETGWGRVDLQNSLFPSGGRKNVFLDDAQKVVATGGSSNFQFYAKSGQRLKVSLVWTDAPSAVFVGKNLVNDLDLQVVAPDGTAFKGNCFLNNTASSSCATFDRVNNVENVYIEAPAEGTYSVQIAGYNVPSGPQPYALVVSGNDVATGSVAPTVDSSKFNPTDNFYLQGAPGAVSLPNARVKAYPWSDSNSNGSVEPAELGTAHELGYSLPNGAVRGTGLSTLGVGTHRFVITAANEFGESAKTTPFTLTLTKGFNPNSPAAPAQPTVNLQNNNQALLKWDPVYEATSYEVKVSETTGGPYTTIASGLTTTEHTYTLPANPKKSYYFVVSAQSGGGKSGYSPEAIVWVPSNIWIKATPANGKVELSWTKAKGVVSDYPHYAIYRKLNGVTSLVITRPSFMDSYIDTAVTNGVEYQYQIVVNEYQFPTEIKTYSNWVTVTPNSNLPGPFALSVKPVSGGAQLTWSASSGAGNYTIIRNGQTIQTGVTGTSFTDSNVTNGTLYTYEIIATHASNSSTRRSEAVTVNPHLPEPSPVALTVTPESGLLRLNWTSSHATSYTIERSTAHNGTFSVIATGVTGTTYGDSTGISGGRYYYRVIASNASGSTRSNLDNGVLSGANTTIPPVPSQLAATAGNTSVQLSWSASSGASSYTVKRGTASSGPFTAIASGLTSTSFNDTGVTNGSTYYYVVAAKNAAGESANSASVQATPIEAPAAPAGLTATAGNASVQLAWPAAARAASYTVKRGLAAAGPFSTVTSGITATSYNDTGLTNGTTYHYVVTASNSAGESGHSPVALATPASPTAAPTGVTASPGDTSVFVSWTASAGATSYTVKRGTASGGPFTTVASQVTGTSFLNTGLTNGTTYYYVVTASGVTGESGPSAVVQAKPVVSPATGAPAAPALSHTNQNQSKNYSVKWTIWWGNNGSSWKLIENNVVIHHAALTDNSPQSQTASYAFTNKAAGTYVYKVEVTNKYGTTSSSTVTVVVS
ncbi:S8 family serine peptidase [Paenibacillus sp. GCM10027627]|uniref:S8 family serine peptidase n=1 Tax=unclassified Paenibacillus TaxID=185978 RepID=UPI003637074E